MRYVVLEDKSVRRLSFYLAMEVFGRNQVAENEVNFEYCRQNGIQVYRRKSGGGCVYADQDNVMMSFVTPEENVGLTFNRFVNMLLLVLRKLGVEATGTTHNDVMIGDRKVSGTAFYHLPGRSIVHSTMLYDTNMEHMLNAITPGPEKLEAKGIKSVRQRITLLKDYTSLPLDEFKIFVRTTLCDGERVLTAEEVKGTEALEQTYLDKDFVKLIKS